MWGFDVVTEEDKGDEEVVDVGLMDWEEDQGYILLLKKHTHTHTERSSKMPTSSTRKDKCFKQQPAFHFMCISKRL